MGTNHDFQELLEAVEAVGEADKYRRTVFREEFADYEVSNLDRFERTHAAIADERGTLAELDNLLAEETKRVEELKDATEHLSVDQAIRTRDSALTKLEAHNRHLRTFHDEVSVALDGIEANLVVIEHQGPEAVENDPEPHLKNAREAIEFHNEAVEGLGKNLRILNAYLF